MSNLTERDSHTKRGSHSPALIRLPDLARLLVLLRPADAIIAAFKTSGQRGDGDALEGNGGE